MNLKVILLSALTLVGADSFAQNAITSIGAPVAEVKPGSYLLHNVGRGSYFFENAYGDLKMGATPRTGCDSGLDYVVTLAADSDGHYTVRTRRGRYIPEVTDGAVHSVGHAENAGHFAIERGSNGHFTIVNTANPAYGFDASENAFVGWDAAKGTNCFYDLIPVETGMGDYPLETYTEPDAGNGANLEEWAALDPDRVYLTWASKDVNYSRHDVPQVRLSADTTLWAWRGERVAVKALVFSASSLGDLKVKITPAAGSAYPAADATARWMRYVITDEHNHCGGHSFDLPTWTVADVIDLPGTAAPVEAMSVRPVWCSLQVPANLPAGAYDFTLTLADGSATLGSLDLRVNVADRVIPAPADWKFHLDLWQQPYSVARYYGVERWSPEHLEALRPYMEMLGRAGQKVVSAVLFHEPWGDQSHDKFDAMVETTLGADGKWRFDFTIFDRWVEFMEECGISARINCFSMIPWDMAFRYVDEKTDTYKFLKTSTSTEEYRDLWTAFLTDFAAHLRAKGWFDKTCISMDERGLQAMLDASKLVKEVVPDMKMALAGNYNAELVDLLDDYCLAYEQRFTPEELERRHAAGRISTIYTCCTEARPNIFTNSDPAEGAYLPVQAIASGTDGYLRWALINWAESPLTDSRFRLFGSGDTYAIYPGPRSSVRFERMVEGIQLTEKMRIMRQLWEAEGDTESLARLDALLEQFIDRKFNYYKTAASMVNGLHSLINGGPEIFVESPADYCPVVLAPANKDAALENRYVTEAVTTGCSLNLDYHATSAGPTGTVTTSQIAVAPGTTFQLAIKCARNSDDMRYCRMVVGADWNRDMLFNPLHGEFIARMGSAKQGDTAMLNPSVTITVPEGATPGKSLLRVCFADAWSPEPELCGELPKGFALDVPMEILSADSSLAAIGLETRTRWHGPELTTSTPACVSVYALNGMLLHRAPGVTAYSLADFTPTLYNVVVTFPDGHSESFKRPARP